MTKNRLEEVKESSSRIARDEYSDHSVEELKKALNAYRAGVYDDPSFWTAFGEVTKEEAKELVARRIALLPELIEEKDDVDPV